MTKGYSSLPIKAVALATGLGLGFLSYPILAASGSGGDTVRGLYDVLVNTMKSGHALGQSGRFMQLAPVIHRSFDIVSMVRLAVGPSWASLTEAQRQRADRKLRPLHFGNLCRPLRWLCRTKIRGDGRTARAYRGHREEPDRQSQWRARPGRLPDAPQRRQLAHLRYLRRRRDQRGGDPPLRIRRHSQGGGY